MAKKAVVGPDAATAEGLPPEAFTDPASLAKELATVFRAAWLAVPERSAPELTNDPRSLLDLVKLRGARLPVQVAGMPLFLQRDWEGTLRAFPNVCTHAWHTLVAGPERERAIVCPQHGRRFDTQGKYQSQPGFTPAPRGFPRECDNLQAFPVAHLGPLTFTNLGAKADLAKAFAPVHASIAKFPMAALQRKPTMGEVRELPGNWKQHCMNYLDPSHIPYLHARPGGLVDALDMDSYQTELHGDSVLQWAYAKDSAHGFDPKHLPKRFHDKTRRVFALWWFLWPNLTLNFYPWGLSVNQYVPVPGKPDRTQFYWYQWSWDEAKYARRDQTWQLQAVDDEDVDAMGQVLRGLSSRLAQRSRFGKGEEAVHWFHRRVSQAVK